VGGQSDQPVQVQLEFERIDGVEGVGNLVAIRVSKLASQMARAASSSKYEPPSGIPAR